MTNKGEFLTEDEFNALVGMEAPKDFKRLLLLATAELNRKTRHYYEFHELEDDFKGRAFKRALALQISFYMDVGATSVESFNNSPDSVSIGDTNVTYNRLSQNSEALKRSDMVSADALNALSGTGLLYRGAGGWGV